MKDKMQKKAIFLSGWANHPKQGHLELLEPLPQAGIHPAQVISPVRVSNQPNVHVLGLWQHTGLPGQTQHSAHRKT